MNLIEKSYLAVMVILVIGCSGSGSGWKDTNLISHGIPITIQAPDSLDVRRSSIAFQEDITLKGSNGFEVQVFISDAYVNNQADAIRSQRESVQESPYFHSIVSEDENGFVFENRIDSSHLSFGFRHVRLMGGKEYVFQEPLISSFTEDQASRLYEAVTSSVK